MAGVALYLRRSGEVAEDECVRRGAVQQAQSDARVGRMNERALALDKEQLAAAFVAFDDEPFRRTGEEVGDDGVDGDPPARDRDPRLPCGDELRAQAAGRAARSSSSANGHLSDRAVRADREHDVGGVPRGSRPSGKSSPGGGRRRSRSSTPWSAASSASSWSSLDELVHAVLDVEPSADARLEDLRQAGGKRPPWVATPTSAAVGPKGRALSTSPMTGTPCSVSPARRESRTATTSSRR